MHLTSLVRNFSVHVWCTNILTELDAKVPIQDRGLFGAEVTRVDLFDTNIDGPILEGPKANDNV